MDLVTGQRFNVSVWHSSSPAEIIVYGIADANVRIVNMQVAGTSTPVEIPLTSVVEAPILYFVASIPDATNALASASESKLVFTAFDSSGAPIDAYSTG